MSQKLVIVALKNATEHYKPPQGLILHSDRGGQYFGLKFKKMLDKYSFKQSMAGKKAADENAHADGATRAVCLGNH